MCMRFLSWNVNGLRSIMEKESFRKVMNGGYDAICLQETRLSEQNFPDDPIFRGYKIYNNIAEKKGYSGTATLIKTSLETGDVGAPPGGKDPEGRVIPVDMGEFWLVNAYFPNSQRDLARLSYKIEFDRSFSEWADSLRRSKPVIICGDFNVAHKEIDIARPKDNERNAGFTIEERDAMSSFLERGYVDTFRLFCSDGGHYTWWSYRFNARQKNIGWRIDYFIVSEELRNRVKDSRILTEVVGSDHAPIEIEIC